MSLKLIELQVAIPRTMDAAKKADELSQRGLIHQAHLTESTRKKQLEDAKKIQAKERTEEGNLLTKGDGEPASLKKKQKSSGEHPFKGQKIDYSG
jgi:Skp family chaperone for outer membrane proteins